MAKARKDNKGRVLLRGESQRSQDMRYVYTYTDPFGKRKYLYATDLMELWQRLKRNLVRTSRYGMRLQRSSREPFLGF